MCGIAGILAAGGGMTAAKVQPLRDALSHRGPDGGHTWISADGRVGLGHRRLSIIDLSTAANQPMISPGGSVALIFNGEIYNHASIRQHLTELGHSEWQTSHSDTEVILMAYRQWGMPACLEHLRGMFAFALWDSTKETLYLARDRAGEKPFYYTTNPAGEFLFASEIKAILADASVKPVVDEVALHDYLTFLTVPPPRTMFSGIFKLPAAHWAEVKPGQPPVVRAYWDALDAAADYASHHTLPAHEEGWVEHLGGVLKESVKLRQEAADVPVGVFLSGGIDSSAVAALVGGQTQQGKLRTFAIGPDASYTSWHDETPFAARMAEQIGSAHTTLRVREQDFLAALPGFIRAQDEPVADPAALPIYLLAKAATDAGLKVCQGGEGSDEIFIGYEDWMKFRKLDCWNRWLPVPRFMKTMAYRLLLAAGQGHKFWVEYLRRAGAGEPIFWGGAEAFTRWEKQQLLGPKMAHLSGRSSYEAIRPYAQAYAAKPKKQKNFWNWCSWLELHLRLPEQLLMRADKTTMAHALELRVPLLDHHLIEAMLNTPVRLRTKGGSKKYLLKRILDGIVPDEILHRRKQGLGLPLNDWIFGVYGSYAHDVLYQFCQQTGYLSWSAVEKLFQQKRGQHIWYLLNLALWHRLYIEGRALEVPA